MASDTPRKEASTPKSPEEIEQEIEKQLAELNASIDSRIRMLKLSGSPIQLELSFAEARSVACAQLLVAAGITTSEILDLYFKRALLSMLDSASRPDAGMGV